MLKSELRNGMVIILRNTKKCVYLNKWLVFVADPSKYIESYDSDTLKHCDNENLDIMEIKMLTEKGNAYDTKILWEREPEIDWSKIEPGTKVIVSSFKSFRVNFEAEFITIYKGNFIVRELAIDRVIERPYCKLMEKE